MKSVSRSALLCLALTFVSLTAPSLPSQAQALSNGVKVLKIKKLPTVETTTTSDSLTTDPTDRVQWGDKRDPAPTPAPIVIDNTGNLANLSASLTTTSTTSSSNQPATHRSRSQSVPEPATLGLLALGGLLLRRRRY